MKVNGQLQAGYYFKKNSPRYLLNRKLGGPQGRPGGKPFIDHAEIFTEIQSITVACYSHSSKIQQPLYWCPRVQGI
jgi:hypothetical protein